MTEDQQTKEKKPEFKVFPNESIVFKHKINPETNEIIKE